MTELNEKQIRASSPDTGGQRAYTSLNIIGRMRKYIVRNLFVRP